MVSKTYYGTTASGQKVHSFLLENRRGTRVSVIEYGCRITHLLVPDRSGRLTDVVLGCRDLEAYEKDDLFLGAFVGRVANRIEGAHFTLEGKEYQLEANNGPNHNHGVWHQRVFEGHALGPDTVEFIYHSPDGEDGFPGNVSVSVRYTLTEGNRLILDYTAAADAVTPINLTNHSYFNLDGAGSTSVLDHKLTVYAHQYTPADAVGGRHPHGLHHRPRHRPGHRRRLPAADLGQRLRPQLCDRPGGTGAGPGCPAGKRKDRHLDGMFHHPARHPDLYRQLPAGCGSGQTRLRPRPPGGGLPGDPAFPLRPQPAQFPQHPAASGPSFAGKHCLRLRLR